MKNCSPCTNFFSFLGLKLFGNLHAAANIGDFEAAAEHLAAADKTMVEAHECQTEMLRQEAQGNPVAVNIILVHAQDHLTMAQVARDMADQMIALYKEIRK